MIHKKRELQSHHGTDRPLLDERRARNAEVIHLGRHRALTATPWNSGCTHMRQTQLSISILSSINMFNNFQLPINSSKALKGTIS